MAAATAFAHSIDAFTNPAAAQTTTMIIRLGEIVRSFSFGRKAVTLSSGKPSTFYFDMKPSMLNPEGAALIASLIFEEAKQVNADFVGGLEMGAVPITGAVCLHSHNLNSPIGGFFVRKEPKKHGEKKLVEGLQPHTSLNGKRVVIVDDVTTTGMSALKAVEALREEGALVVLAISIVDREEGATENFAKAGIKLVSLLKASDFLN